MGLLQNANAIPTAAAAADFYDHQIAQSCRFDGSARTTRTLDATATDRDKYTFSTWFKRSIITSNKYLFSCETNNTNYDILAFGSDDTIRFTWQRGGASGEVWAPNLYRDTSAWMHIVVQFDTTQASEDDRVKIYINGVQSTLSESRYDGWIPQDEDLELNANSNKFFVSGSDSYGGYPEMYLAQTAGIDGSVVAIGDLGESKNGVWIPKDLSGLTFGNNGFLLEYATNTAFGDDTSGNGNDFTDVNLATSDQMLDSPTFDSSSNGGNFATLGPLWKTPNMTFSEGNLKWATSTNQRGVMSNWSVPLEGKWYWEYIPTAFGASSGDDSWCGLNIATVNFTASRGGEGTSYSYGANSGQKNIAGTKTSYGDAWGDDDKIGVAVDRVNDTIQFSNNGVWQGSAFAIPATADLFPWIGSGGGTSAASGTFNFGADGTFAGLVTAQGNADENGYGNFFYAPPSGFVALCSGNLPTPAADPADDAGPYKYFVPKLYTGDGASTLTISGLEFQPDWTWIKNRDTADAHCLFDSTRGVTKLLSSDSTAAESTDTDTLKSWTSDGFTVGADVKVNTNTENYVSWNWKVNGGTTVANTTGDIDSVVQVDADRGFSIVTYTGTLSGSGVETVGHGLGVAPNLIITKGVGLVSNWWVFSDEQTSWNYGLNLNTTAASADKSGNGSMSAPTTTVFSTNWTDGINDSEGNIAYCFVNKEGYIKSGKYVGNTNADGTFVYTGFRPAMMILREYDQTDNWGIYDDKRDGQNNDSGDGNAVLYPDVAAAEENQASRAIDILSNGFKLRTSNATFNGGNYIYLAIAKNPFKYATAR